MTQFEAGDEVFGLCHGTFAEYACAREDKLEPKPANLTFEQAADRLTRAASEAAPGILSHPTGSRE